MTKVYRRAILRQWLGTLVGCTPLLACGTESPKDVSNDHASEGGTPYGSQDAGHSNASVSTQTSSTTPAHDAGATSNSDDQNTGSTNPDDASVDSTENKPPGNEAGAIDAGASDDGKSNSRDAEATTRADASSNVGPVSSGDDEDSEPDASDDGFAVDLLVSSTVEKVDLLFVVDNSMSMADKQAILQEALPDLMERFVNPVCIDANGEEVARPDGTTMCPFGSAPEFNPIKDINIGVITSSLGGFGSDSDCLKSDLGITYDQTADMAHLVGSLERGANMGGDFLAWRSDTDLSAFMTDFRDQVGAVGEFGCGWEATMESWVRFLVDPFPYQEVVRAPCNQNDTANSCGKPKTDELGQPLVDQVVLQQRSQFLRMDSLLAVIMLSDENDCSFKVGGQQVLLADTQGADGRQSTMYRASSACAPDPNDPCCHSCGTSTPSGCERLGCDEPTYPETNATAGAFFEDQINLRCFKQKQRFGLDFLYPVERYANALSLARICPTATDLRPDNCEPDSVVDNPVFTAMVDGTQVTRPQSMVFLGGILGVPWQDVALDPTGQEPLEYKKARDATGAPTIDWDILLGEIVDEDKPAGVLKRQQYPTLSSGIDPLMFESVLPRSGVNAATNQPLAGADAAFMANTINGHEWNPLEGSDLQYACIYKLTEPVSCPTRDESRQLEETEGERQPNCDCTYYQNTEELEYNTPLCQSNNGYGLTQTYAKAYPGTRELQALELFSELNPQKNAIVASICPKETEDQALPDYGYRPAVATIVDRLKEQLQVRCLPRPLSMNDEGNPNCVVVEASPEQDACVGDFRQPVDETTARAVQLRLESGGYCTGHECDAYQLCVVPEIARDATDYEACIAGTGGNGWCYVDAAQYTDEPPATVVNALASCPATAKRKLTFAGQGSLAAPSSHAFYVCAPN